MPSRSDTNSSLVAISAVVPTPTSTLCGSPTVLYIPSRPAVTTGTEIHLGRKVVSSACMEALMQHHKATGFLDKVSRLAAAPRRSSANCMYDDRWLRFTHWASGEGFNPLSSTAAQVATFLYSLLTPMVYRHKLSEATGLVWTQ